MNKNIVKFLAVLVMCFMITAVLVACQGEVGPQGAQGVKGDQGEQGRPGTDGKDGADGKDGIDGEDGEDGVGIASALINENGELVLTYTDGTTANLGKVTGEDGKDGDNYVTCAPDAHDFDAIVIADTNGNWFTLEVCDACGWAELGCGHSVTTTNYVAPTCIAAGYTHYVCDLCAAEWDVTDETAPALGHDVPVLDENNPGAWVLDFNETGLCDCEWIRTYNTPCTRCGETQHAMGTAAGHVYDEAKYEPALNHSNACDCLWVPVEIAPCENCDHDDCYGSRVADGATPKGHTWGNWVIGTAPTAETAGDAFRICTECGVAHAGIDGTETLVLPALNLTDYAYNLVSAAACAVDGSAEWTYTHTDGTTVVVTETLTKLGHTYTTGVVTKLPERPTELADGYTLEEMDAHIATFNGAVKFTCDVCGAAHEEAIPAITPALGRFIIATGDCMDPVDTYVYPVVVTDPVNGNVQTIDIQFQVNGLYVHDEAPAKEDCQQVTNKEGTKIYYVYKCDKCDNWIVAYFETIGD